MLDNNKKTNKTYSPLPNLTKLTTSMDAFLPKPQAKSKTSKLSQGTIQTWLCNDYHTRLNLDKTNGPHAKIVMQQLTAQNNTTLNQDK